MSTATIAAPSLPSPDLIRRRALHARGLRLLQIGTIVLAVTLGALAVVFVGHVILNYQPPPVVTITTTGATSTPADTPTIVVVPEPAPPPDESGGDGFLVPIAIAALTALPGTLTAIAGLVLVLRSHHYPTAPPPPPET
ncbi:hypothetical protein [Parafrankia discariae]|uniref:hypothetical protein n=1 Tax=Parafrankia discariae TaxID=365528 RepID=UPI00039CF7F4|nr:hypothetical protein [Parafrankia discariae]